MLQESSFSLCLSKVNTDSFIFASYHCTCNSVSVLLSSVAWWLLVLTPICMQTVLVCSACNVAGAHMGGITVFTQLVVFSNL